jgi:hypothetical protein
VGIEAVFLVAAAVAGVVAAILPARRAARLNVLEAIQADRRGPAPAYIATPPLTEST